MKFLFIRANIVNRFGLFQKIFNIIPSSDYLSQEIGDTSELNCLKRCMFKKNCLSAVHGARKCLLYTSDPRIAPNATFLVHETSTVFTLLLVRNDLGVPCYVGSVQAYSEAYYEKCGLEGKTKGNHDYFFYFVVSCNSTLN